MLDIASAYNKYQFLGNEFLTWIWYLIETEQNITNIIQKEFTVSLEIGHTIVLENHLGENAREKITIKGDQAGLEEGTTALKKGALVTQMHLKCMVGSSEDGQEKAYEFTLKGESFHLTGLKMPKTSPSEDNDETEAEILEKAFLLETIIQVIDNLFLCFVTKRISPEWKTNEIQKISDWIYS